MDPTSMRFVRNVPHSCKKVPAIIDLPRGTPHDMQIANYSNGRVHGIRIQPLSAFQITVGVAGTINKTVLTLDGRRVTQALMKWRVACMHFKLSAQKKLPNVVLTFIF